MRHFWTRKTPGSLVRFWTQTAGNFASMAAIIAPVILSGVAGMVDFGRYRANVATLQSAADAAALAATSEAVLQGWTQEVAQAAAEAYVAASFEGAKLLKGDYSIVVTVDTEDRKVTVNVNQDDFEYLFVGFVKIPPYITASATAQAISDANVCVVGLMAPVPRGPKSAVHLDNRSQIDSPECGIYSDSAHRYGFRIDRNASVRANVVCSAGGFWFASAGRSISVDPEPTYDCPKKGDPLESRPAPSIGSCDYNGLVVTTPTSLSPGVYCEGLTINGNVKVTAQAGEYTIKDGPIVVDGGATLEGTDVGFFLTGPDSLIDFREDSTIDLSARISGPLAGLLFYEDRDVPHSFDFNPFHLDRLPADVRLHRVSSNDARTLVGTIYLPRSLLLINANAPVADKSAYTAIVVGRLWLQRGPTLVLNADYAATTVPVPDGIGAAEKGVRLID